ncbi:DJ-1/PfpI family protein [Corynebacterium fournieri]|uniref:DJ-1/PfpI family protein n=1 Tax=Corynebacterium fournieri TaxID=1852390 RepID=UPI000A2EF0C8|nr:DJ-1/PfpI family protein [Corynebacterium fournieri]WJY97313.1 putative protease YdeA [Corynebacterium fournieri]
MRTIAIYATETMADWEFAYLTTQIAEAEAAVPGRFRVAFVGERKAPVHSKGGMVITPSITLDDLEGKTDIAVFVVPGADTYFHGHEALIQAMVSMRGRGVPIAGICGGTVALARAGMLDEVQHTSNAVSFLAYTGYKGQARYCETEAVSDSGVVTASGLAPVDFTAEVLRVAEVFPESVIDAWVSMHQEKSEVAFLRHLESIKAWRDSQ